MRMRLGRDLVLALEAAVERWMSIDGVRRLWARDASLWTNSDESSWLGWLGLVPTPSASLGLADLTDRVTALGIRDVLLVGMGGSSLAPEVVSQVVPSPFDSPTLHVLDSTDPAQIGRVLGECDLSRTLCISSSKSGATLETSLLTDYVLEQLQEHLASKAVGGRCLAITDSGSLLEELARRREFLAILHGVSSVGGRFSALSNFGLVPPLLCGRDIETLVDRAAKMAVRCGGDVEAGRNPGAKLGLALGTAALMGRDKVTFILSPAIASLGCWLEQLLAESTGKVGRGLLPIVDEELGAPASYGADRLFVYLRLAEEFDPEQEESVERLAGAGLPVIDLTLSDRFDLGGEFFRWEMAVAVCGSLLRVHPFDQPDVEAGKRATLDLAAAYESSGAWPERTSIAVDVGLEAYADPETAAALRQSVGPGAGVQELLLAHLGKLGPQDYFALLAYLEQSPDYLDLLKQMRTGVRQARGVATTIGFGPGFLHSMGQTFKGGPDNGVFLQITCDDEADLPIPGRGYTFGGIKRAQADGDLQVLVSRGRRVLGVHLWGDVGSALKRLTSMVMAAA